MTVTVTVDVTVTVQLGGRGLTGTCGLRMGPQHIIHDTDCGQFAVIFKSFPYVMDMLPLKQFYYGGDYFLVQVLWKY